MWKSKTDIIFLRFLSFVSFFAFLNICFCNCLRKKWFSNKNLVVMAAGFVATVSKVHGGSLLSFKAKTLANALTLTQVLFRSKVTAKRQIICKTQHHHCTRNIISIWSPTDCIFPWLGAQVWSNLVLST